MLENIISWTLEIQNFQIFISLGSSRDMNHLLSPFVLLLLYLRDKTGCSQCVNELKPYQRCVGPVCSKINAVYPRNDFKRVSICTSNVGTVRTKCCLKFVLCQFRSVI